MKTQREREAEQGAQEEAAMAEEQPELQRIQGLPESQPAQPGTEEVLPEAQESLSEVPEKKRGKKKKLTEADMQPPKPSIWPLALALALVIMMAGSAFNALFLGIGAFLVLICIIGWALERRH